MDVNRRDGRRAVVTRWALVVLSASAATSCSSATEFSETASTPESSPKTQVVQPYDLAQDSRAVRLGPLYDAIAAHDHEEAARLLNAGLKPVGFEGIFPATPLAVAIIEDDVEMVRMLLDAGAPTAYDDTGDPYGLGTSTEGDRKARPHDELWAAASFAGGEVVQALIDAGADPNGLAAQRDIPLAGAATANNVPAMLVLLEAGARVDMLTHPDQMAVTPLHLAASSGSREAAEVLLDWGANPAQKSRSGDTAADLAFKFDHPDLGEYLAAVADL